MRGDAARWEVGDDDLRSVSLLADYGFSYDSRMGHLLQCLLAPRGASGQPVIPTFRANQPRRRRVRQVIVDAAVEVMLTDGAEHMTAMLVADRTDVARTTIYRHWPDQASLLLATIDAVTFPHHSPPNVGCSTETVSPS